jgi:Carboxypeptidase regulatory-like domain
MIRLLLLTLILLTTARGQSGFGVSDAFQLDTVGTTGANRSEGISGAFDLNTRFASGIEVSGVSGAFPLDTRVGAGEMVGFQFAVKDAETGALLPETLVKLKWGSQTFAQGLTASNGRYHVEDVPRQSYTVVVHKSGYATRVFTQSPPLAGLTTGRPSRSTRCRHCLGCRR